MMLMEIQGDDFGFPFYAAKKGGRVKTKRVKKGFAKKEKTSKQNEEKIMPGTMMMKRPMMKKGKALKKLSQIKKV